MSDISSIALMLIKSKISFNCDSERWICVDDYDIQFDFDENGNLIDLTNHREIKKNDLEK